MGKTIDRIVALAAAALILYLLFARAFGSILPAYIASFVCCAALIRLMRRRAGKMRMTAAQAGTILRGWAYAPDEEARIHVERLLEVEPGGSALVYLSRHPESAVSIGDVFNAWKKHLGEDRILIAATCHADAKARIYAASLKNPAVEIADAQKLIARIRRSDLTPPSFPRGRALMDRLKRALTALPYRRSWRRNGWFGALLFGLYWLGGNPAYLFLGMSALFLAGIGLRGQRT